MAPDSPLRSRSFLAVVALAAVLLFVRLGRPDWTPAVPNPAAPKRYVWDECIYAFSAHRYLEGDPGAWRTGATFEELRVFDATDVGPHVTLVRDHPPLSAFAMAASYAVLGWSAFAARLPGALCGVVLVACTWILGRRVRGERVATLAASLVALDGVWFTISRVAIPHVHVAAASVAGLTAGLVAWRDDARRARFTLVSGALLGLGVAFKESAVVFTVLVGALLLRRAWTAGAPGMRRRGLAAWTVAFLVLPPAIYLASWLPFFVGWDKSWSDFAAFHVGTWRGHAAQPARMGPSTPWWTWPVIWKPVRLFEEATADGAVRQIVARGNPFLWWAAVAAIPWTVVRFARTRAAADLWLAAGYFATWLVYAFVPRFGFSYYLLPAAPCAAVAVAALVEHAAGADDARRRFALWTFGALAAGAFAAAYPWLAALPCAR